MSACSGSAWNTNLRLHRVWFKPRFQKKVYKIKVAIIWKLNYFAAQKYFWIIIFAPHFRLENFYRQTYAQLKNCELNFDQPLLSLSLLQWVGYKYEQIYSNSTSAVAQWKKRKMYLRKCILDRCFDWQSWLSAFFEHLRLWSNMLHYHFDNLVFNVAFHTPFFGKYFESKNCWVILFLIPIYSSINKSTLTVGFTFWLIVWALTCSDVLF